MCSLTRRDFVRKTALATAAVQLAAELKAADRSASPRGVSDVSTRSIESRVHWLEGTATARQEGVTWGMPWPRGERAATSTFGLISEDGTAVPVQSWPLATWPDGSLKWTAHALPPGVVGKTFLVQPSGTPALPAQRLTAKETATQIEIDTGVIRIQVEKTGSTLISSVWRGGRETLKGGRVVVLRRPAPEASVQTEERFQGKIESIELEQSGPVRAVVKITGAHHAEGGDGSAWIPFVVRLYAYSGGETLRMMHTLIIDGDHRAAFIGGVGVRFEVPMDGAWHDRHVRFSGQGQGVFGEAVRGLTGLRRDPGEAVRKAQVEGQATPPVETWAKTVSSRLDYIAAYDDWTLFQANADGFDLHKRTKAGCTWLTAAQGQRAGGLGYIGSPQGGVAFGLRNFWQSHPAQLDIRGATQDRAEVTVWMWAPKAPAMDLRPYHDGLGQDTYEKQYNGGLEITYEDYEPGFDTPEGVARTSELQVWILPSTPSRTRFAEMAETLRTPPQLVAAPQYLQACTVFGGLWSPVDRSTPERAAVEERLDRNFAYYQEQQEQRRWYGFWNYGDVMHTYDVDRHEWRYDVGGYAWDNSELSTDLWLWLYFLKSGRADVFRFAEAMTRHTGEVDVHHRGRFAPLGSRHNVLHWGCSAKQLRISTAVNRRYYYYLTADERVGDLMREQIEAGHALLRTPPGRKLSSAAVAGDLDRGASSDATRVGVSFGTDWGSLAGAWLTEWERTGSPEMKARLLAGMRSMGEQPYGFFTTGSTLNLLTGAFHAPEKPGVGVSHLNAVFGLVEVCAELIQLLDVPEFKKVWLDYCEIYNGDDALQRARLGTTLTRGPLTQGHSRLTAYVAKMNGDPALAERAWAEFRREPSSGRDEPMKDPRTVEGPAVLREVEERPYASTNDVAQWGLAAIQNLALLGAPRS